LRETIVLRQDPRESRKKRFRARTLCDPFRDPMSYFYRERPRLESVGVDFANRLNQHTEIRFDRIDYAILGR
jgi:hypothetical protein